MQTMPRKPQVRQLSRAGFGSMQGKGSANDLLGLQLNSFWPADGQANILGSDHPCTRTRPGDWDP